MKKTRFVLLALCVVAVIAIFAIILGSIRQKNMDCESIADTTARDDCWHDLAHATNDGRLCNKIADTAEKEHCIGHVAE